MKNPIFHPAGFFLRAFSTRIVPIIPSPSPPRLFIAAAHSPTHPQSPEQKALPSSSSTAAARPSFAAPNPPNPTAFTAPLSLSPEGPKCAPPTEEGGRAPLPSPSLLGGPPLFSIPPVSVAATTANHPLQQERRGSCRSRAPSSPHLSLCSQPKGGKEHWLGREEEEGGSPIEQVEEVSLNGGGKEGGREAQHQGALLMAATAGEEGKREAPSSSSSSSGVSVCVCDLTIAEEKGEGSHPILPQSSGEGPTHTHTHGLPTCPPPACWLLVPSVRAETLSHLV